MTLKTTHIRYYAPTPDWNRARDMRAFIGEDVRVRIEASGRTVKYEPLHVLDVRPHLGKWSVLFAVVPGGDVEWTVPVYRITEIGSVSS